jgi:hypothetical protein
MVSGAPVVTAAETLAGRSYLVLPGTGRLCDERCRGLRGEPCRTYQPFVNRYRDSILPFSESCAMSGPRPRGSCCSGTLTDSPRSGSVTSYWNRSGRAGVGVAGDLDHVRDGLLHVRSSVGVELAGIELGRERQPRDPATALDQNAQPLRQHPDRVPAAAHGINLLAHCAVLASGVNNRQPLRRP